MKRKNKLEFSLALSGEKIEQTYKLSPEMKLTWLEEANTFINSAVSKRKRRTWERLFGRQ